MRNGDDMAQPNRGDTFSSIKLDPQQFAMLPFADFVAKVLAELETLKQKRADFYETRRVGNAPWARRLRPALAWLGALAILLTALATVVRLGSVDWFGEDADKLLLASVVVIYAAMAAISFYDKNADKTSTYFRQIATILAVRDLWTKLQFALVKELRAFESAADRAAVEEGTRARILTIAEAFNTDLDKLATGELGDFRTEFLDSLKQLEEASQKGLQDVTKRLEDRAEEDKKAVEAREAAKKKEETEEKARADKEAAAKKADDDKKATEAKALADAARAGSVNVTIAGDFARRAWPHQDYRAREEGDEDARGVRDARREARRRSGLSHHSGLITTTRTTHLARFGGSRLQEAAMETAFIYLRKPWQNGASESFNWKLRDELLLA
jgi:hypothetical protein